MKNLSDISIWRQSFGLLPIHLKPNQSETDFVMLNGGYGDFCLQTAKDESELKDYYSKFWSSNTSNFIVLENDKIKIINWARDFQEEVPQKTVADNFDKFYNYLLSKSYKSSKDVVSFIIDIFRQFRNITQERANPVEALNLLFVLLASLEDDYKNLDTKKWNIHHTDIPNGFEYFIEKIHSGINQIKPEIELIIRHSAGILFQEAQKEVLFFNPQRDLFGGISNKLETSNKLYSSIHYTPPYITRTVVENSLKQLNLGDKNNIKIFDPACGSSEFLIEALKQLKELRFEGKIELVGWDSSETDVNTSNFLLKYEQRTIWEDKLSFEIRLVNDSLTEVWNNDYDLILMNPPFVSWELLNTKDSRDAVRDTLGDVLTGKPNQASAFFYKSLFHLNNNGVVGSVVPSSLLTLDSHKKLRNSTMKKFLTALFMASILLSCEEEPINQSPEISMIISPDKEVYYIGETIAIAMVGTDPDKNPFRIKLQINDNQVLSESRTVSRYNWDTRNTVPGIATLKAICEDNKGGAAVIEAKVLLKEFPELGFSASQTTCDIRDSILFTNKNTNEDIEWIWKFGDGSEQKAIHVKHAYLRYGAYGVTLEARTGDLVESVSLTEPIQVKDLRQDITGESGFLTDVEGNEYTWIGIGKQAWMAENLRVTKYADGTPLPLVTDSIKWFSKSGLDIIYTWNSDSALREICGVYYSWAAATKGDSSSYNPSSIQGICPSGWHLPSYDEWNELFMHVYNESWTLATVGGWEYTEQVNTSGNDTIGNNSTGFGAYPAGWYYGNYFGIGRYANWWTARRDRYGFRGVTIIGDRYAPTLTQLDIDNVPIGKNVRCVRD